MLLHTTHGRIEDSDWIALLEFVYRRRLRFFKLVAVGSLPIIFCGIAFSSQLLALLGIGLLSAGIADIVFVRYWMRKLLAGNPILMEPAHATIDDVAIVVETESGVTTRIPWSTIIRIEPYREQYLLWYGKALFSVVFRRGLSEEDWAEYEAFVLSVKDRLESGTAASPPSQDAPELPR